MISHKILIDRKQAHHEHWEIKNHSAGRCEHCIRHLQGIRRTFLLPAFATIRELISNLKVAADSEPVTLLSKSSQVASECQRIQGHAWLISSYCVNEKLKKNNRAQSKFIENNMQKFNNRVKTNSLYAYHITQYFNLFCVFSVCISLQLLLF